MIQKPSKPDKGFTLIELVAVITIIVILGAISVGGMAFVNQARSKKEAEVTIALLSKAMEDYKLDMGKYPGLDEDSPLNGDISDEIYDALFYEGYRYAEDESSWVEGDATKIYLPQLDPRNRKQTLVESTLADTPDSGLKIRDPWGRPYRYRKGDNSENPDFDLWSMGEDGKTNPSDPTRQDEVNVDDIRNF